jgi:hypothetical protein
VIRVAATVATPPRADDTGVGLLTVTNETTERLMASYRCTQLILY